MKSLTLWLSGPSGSGKSTLCRALEETLLKQGRIVEVLDENLFRKNVCWDLGFSDADVRTNAHRIAEVANNLTMKGWTVLVACSLPTAELRKEIEDRVVPCSRIELCTPRELCERRDPQGLYEACRDGRVVANSLLADHYECVGETDYVLDTEELSVNEAVEFFMERLKESGALPKKLPVDRFFAS